MKTESNARKQIIKSAIYFFALSVFLFQCKNDTQELKPTKDLNDGTELQNYNVTLTDAVTIASNTMSITESARTSKQARYSSTSDENPFTSSKKEVLSKETVKDGEDDMYHIINYKDNQGFVIISADKRCIPILAYSDNNPFRNDGLAGISEWFEVAKYHIKKAKQKDRPEPGISQLWKVLEGSVKKDGGRVMDWTGCDYFYNYHETGRYVDNVARWNQSGSTKYYSTSDNGCTCQRRAAGCGAVAMGMVMRYHQYPSNVTLCYNSSCFVPDYPSMPRETDTDCGFPSTTGRNQRALLTRIAGAAASSNYGVLGNCNTWTIPGNINNALQSGFFFANGGTWGSLSSKYAQVKSDLNNYFPVIFTGTLNGVNANDAHIWVGDGYSTLSTQYKTYVGCDENGDNCIEDCRNYDAEYIGMNWGWGGTSNGYFFTTYSFSTDNGTYDTYLRALTGIRPN
ncbi:C10 family peptidase [Dyadobacter chenwenxiniae]|uniref:C10 family peptidase n=1 Tax=Dyadobacter chenwenxiniae TaxID=2906456 RepID=A0A9X1PLR1_9BACT|nr:C10 family peptidase [Dyadobacter chenwenxiniae]MCF0063188.1 C10 family peptidase [Dyadobacter chenwenxiniae]UON85432.1 C10 family peptidase [Dyadobacter chenwenxiniae]